MIQPFIKVGYWAPESQPDLLKNILYRLVSGEVFPRVEDCIDQQWILLEKLMVLSYLNNKLSFTAEYGTSTCRLCGLNNGSKTYNDNVYQWPEGLAHYIQTHNVKPPQEFIEHIRKQFHYV